MDAPLDEIGRAAGAVWRYLHEHGETSVSRLTKGVAMPARKVDQAIGWLAREDKVCFIQRQRVTLLSLR